MKQSHLKMILAVLGVGLVVYGAATLFGGFDGFDGGGSDDVFSIEAPGEPEMIRIADGPSGETIVLERSGDSWTVNGHRVDEPKVADLLPALDTASTTDLVARNPGNHARMGVTETDGRLITVRTGDGETLFLIGNRDLREGGYFVRLPDEDAVYRLGGPVGGYLGRDLTGWRDRDIVEVDTARATRAVITRDGETSTLERTGEGWLVDGGPADSAAVANLLSSSASLRASGFPDDSVAEAADFAASDSRLEMLAEDGSSLLVLSFLAGAGEDDPWLARRTGDPETYLIALLSVDRLVPRLDALAALPDEEDEEER